MTVRHSRGWARSSIVLAVRGMGDFIAPFLGCRSIFGAQLVFLGTPQSAMNAAGSMTGLDEYGLELAGLLSGWERAARYLVAHLEEGILESLGSGGALCRIPARHMLDQLEGLRRSIRQQLAQGRRCKAWEAKVHGVSQLDSFSPCALSWRSKHGADSVHLVSLRAPGKQRS
eukprot:scaffold897_cov402-Prasinococcus_capsulatus_cf.AAC.73